VIAPEIGPREPWSLRRRVTALCLLAAVMLTFLAAGAATTAMANRGQLDRLLDVIGPMRTASNTLLTDLVNQETAIRGYALNRSADNLVLYRANLADEQFQENSIATSPAVTDEILADLRTAVSLANRWRAEVADPVIAAVQAGDTIRATALTGDESRVLFNQVRDAITTLQNSMQEVRNESVASVRDTNSTLLFVLVVAVGLVLASVIGLLVALQRLIISPVTDLAAQVRSVARGNYDHDITTGGPPELARLAVDVDTMRRQIASDLAEVELARRQIEAAHEQLESQAEELMRSNRDLEQFAYVASHDLQEPLRKVASFCQLLQRRYAGQLDERADQYISFAVDGAHRMQRLINDLLKFSRIGRVTSDFTDVNLGAVVAAAAEASDDALARADGTVEADDLPTIRGDEGLLVGLFANLINNSIKFHRVDTPVRIRVTAVEHDDEWQITFRDNGIGIDPEYADKVFVIFQRLHARDAYPGTGIGLAVAKRIVEYHGGRIWVDTSVDEGAAICFTVRTAPPAVEQHVVGEQPAAQAVDALNSAH